MSSKCSRPVRALGALVAVAGLIGCTTVEVNFDYDPAVDFSPLRTYAWMARPDPANVDTDPRLNNALLESRVRAAVDRELGAKGYRLVTDDPDFVVNYHVAVDRKLQADAIGYGGGWYGGRGGLGADVYVREYEEGTLLVDILRPGGKQLLWRGSASTLLDDNPTPEERTARVNKAVHKLIEGFPPGAAAQQ